MYKVKKKKKKCKSDVCVNVYNENIYEMQKNDVDE
jgi:hypothetical protein